MYEMSFFSHFTINRNKHEGLGIKTRRILHRLKNIHLP
jgi:hypothetical protein